MAKVGIRALKQNASEVVAMVVSGKMVTVTDRGRPVAQIVPMASTRVEALVASEQARPVIRRLRDLPAPARRKHGQARLAESLEELRQAERY